MTEEEHAIVTFLGASPETFFARKEIARKAVKRRLYEENPHWLDGPLVSLVLQRLVEQNDAGLYRIKRENLPQ